MLGLSLSVYGVVFIVRNVVVYMYYLIVFNILVFMLHSDVISKTSHDINLHNKIIIFILVMSVLKFSSSLLISCSLLDISSYISEGDTIKKTDSFQIAYRFKIAFYKYGFLNFVLMVCRILQFCFVSTENKA